MTIQQSSAEEYASLFTGPVSLYGSAQFCELNRHKCPEGIEYILILDAKGKVRFGLAGGLRGGGLRVPFSAPFGCFEEAGVQRVDHWTEAMAAVRDWLGGRRLTITLPPPCYDRSGALARQHLAMLSCGGSQMFADYNYHLPLTLLDEGYLARLDSRTRYNINLSMRKGFCFEAYPDASEEMLRRAYKVIYLNHTGLGYPVHMSEDDVVATSAVIPMDVFIARRDGEDQAAGIIYRPAPGAAQLIYWGDDLGHRPDFPMNFLAYNILRHYSSIPGIEFFDFGPSSTDGIPAEGLCRFKQSLGGVLTPKVTISF
ncbi:MAG: hypothetical protein K2H94_00415 [Duncaniella sp.]|nr:hypothetical protein [Duncaniella sp.]